MKCLIVYRSRHGTTRKVVHQLAAGLAPVADVTTVDLSASRAPDLSLFDTVIIGGSIHAGQIQKEIISYCMHQTPQLLTKQLGVFICYMNKKEGVAELQKAFSPALLQHAAATGLFGGELLFEKMNFFEKLIVRKVSGVKQSISALDQPAIESFLNQMRQPVDLAVEV